MPVVSRAVVTALNPVRAEQVRRPEQSQVPGRGDCFAYLNWEKPAQWDRRNRPRLSKSGPRADIGGPEHHPLYIFVFIRFWPYLSYLFFSFLAEGAMQYEISHHRTAHHVPGSVRSDEQSEHVLRLQTASSEWSLQSTRPLQNDTFWIQWLLSLQNHSWLGYAHVLSKRT